MQAISKLRPHLGTEFQQLLLDAASLSISALDNLLRLNNFSSAFRELVRHVFDHLAPDDEVKRCPWYKPEPSSKTGVTRAHRVGFVIHGGISLDYARDELDVDIDTERKSLSTAMDALSKFAHVNPATFGLPANEVETHVADACAALENVLLTADIARQTLAAAIEGTVEKEVVSTVLQETVASVNEISSHHFIEDVSLEKVQVLRIGATEIEFVAHGTLEVELLWGGRTVTFVTTLAPSETIPDLARRRLREQPQLAWNDAWAQRGGGSTTTRRIRIEGIYERWVPIPDARGDKTVVEFMGEIEQVVLGALTKFEAQVKDEAKDGLAGIHKKLD